MKIKKTLETLKLRNFLFEVLGEEKRSKVRFILMQDIFADSFLFLCLGFSVLQVQTALVNPLARPVTDPAWT